MKAGVVLLALAVMACGAEAADDGGSGGATTGATTTAAAGGAQSTATGAGGATGGEVPTGAALVDFLEAGAYLSFEAESEPHPSAGPHFGDVRTFVNPILAASLESGATSHPAGAATVKELYGDGNEVLGWSVWVKLDAESAAGENFYWYERFETTTYADGNGESLCTGCHAAGIDFYRGPVPLP